MPEESNRPQMPYERLTKEQYETYETTFSDTTDANCKNGVCTVAGKSVEESETI